MHWATGKAEPQLEQNFMSISKNGETASLSSAPSSFINSLLPVKCFVFKKTVC